PCGKPGCKVCAHIVTTDTARSTKSNFTMRIDGDLTCCTPDVVYLLECQVCQTEVAIRSLEDPRTPSPQDGGLSAVKPEPGERACKQELWRRSSSPLEKSIPFRDPEPYAPLCGGRILMYSLK
ncbi:hypothetical protein HPB47_007175, partial [Ixodes persulcatus]